MIVGRRPWQAEDVGELLVSGPGEQAVFMPGRAAAPKLAEALVALANAHGGTLVIGVSPQGRVTGVEDAAGARSEIQAAQLLAAPPLILPLPQTLLVEGKALCLVEVPSGLPHAYNLDGRYLTRSGSQIRLLSPGELAALLLQRSETGFEARPPAGAELTDLDMGQIQQYLESTRSGAEPWESTLLGRGCLVRDGDRLMPTYAGILLFGRQPQRFLRNAEIILVRYPGTEMGDEFVRHDAVGTLAEQIRQSEGFVLANMRRGMRLDGFTRTETTEYPVPVVREAIVNAVAHRDYAIRGEGIRVLIFSDRMEVYSPGRLPGHVTLQNLMHERFSRNEAIVQVLSDLGFVERLGYGIDRMVQVLAEAGLAPPRFEETAAGFRVTLYGQGDQLVSPVATPRWGNRRLSERQERALAYLAERGSITNREFRELFPDVSDETIRRDLADLVDQGLIMKVGDRKATYYILKAG